MQPIDLILDDPVRAALVVLALRATLAYQRGLSWTEYRPIHAFKRRVLPRLGAPFAHAKGGRDDAEYLRSVEATPGVVFRRLADAGGSPHLVCSVKTRATDGAVSRAHVVWRHGDGTQTESFLFDNGDGTCDVYSHKEPSVLHPWKHLNGKQINGDPRGAVTDALDAAE